MVTAVEAEYGSTKETYCGYPLFWKRFFFTNVQTRLCSDRMRFVPGDLQVTAGRANS